MFNYSFNEINQKRANVYARKGDKTNLAATAA